MGKRNVSINALLERCDADIKKIEMEYANSLDSQQIRTELQVDIKNFCENLRSVLDYIAHDIRELHCSSANPNVRFYFPIFLTRTEFEAKTNNWYPSLETNAHDLWLFLESVQPYHEPWHWLGTFNKINNENKHGELVAQTRTETEQISVSFPVGSASWIPQNVKFGSGAFIGGIPVDPRTQMPVPHPSQKVERIVWVDFRFDGENVSALGLLKQTSEGIRNIVKIVEKWL